MIFRLLRGFSFKSFLYSEPQSHGRHHKIRRKIPYRTVFVWSLGDVGEIGFTPKTVQKSDFTRAEIA